jgi:hypothetical protein
LVDRDELEVKDEEEEIWTMDEGEIPFSISSLSLCDLFGELTLDEPEEKWGFAGFFCGFCWDNKEVDGEGNAEREFDGEGHRLIYWERGGEEGGRGEGAREVLWKNGEEVERVWSDDEANEGVENDDKEEEEVEGVNESDEEWVEKEEKEKEEEEEGGHESERRRVGHPIRNVSYRMGVSSQRMRKPLKKSFDISPSTGLLPLSSPFLLFFLSLFLSALVSFASGLLSVSVLFFSISLPITLYSSRRIIERARRMSFCISLFFLAGKRALTL